MVTKNSNPYWIKFLGTAGARFVMIKQLRASGGLWLKSGDTNILIDPGPGSIVRCAASRPKLDPAILNAVILTHRHLDHANDVNVMIEGMTEGGSNKRGVVFAPADALGADTVILKHAQGYVGKIEALEPQKSYRAGDFVFETTPALRHPCQTYGLKFVMNNTRVALLTDTEYFPELIDYFQSDCLIINVVFLEPRCGVQHLSFHDVREIVKRVAPKRVILTHFGMTMLKAHPHELARALSWETGVAVEAATDGMTVVF
ncbi:MAG TPA: MBL fold hydrolase [Candidatus Omnitrophica bacterium]|nr:MBL fold hydrolase [Candidatus Omnitrophota bacterium]